MKVNCSIILIVRLIKMLVDEFCIGIVGRIGINILATYSLHNIIRNSLNFLDTFLNLKSSSQAHPHILSYLYLVVLV